MMIDENVEILNTDFEKDGFYGQLAIPAKNRFPGKAIIAVGGGDGCFGSTKHVVDVLARNGVTAMAVAYWNQPGLRTTVTRVPLEIGATAARWLKDRGYEQIGMWGLSKGAEFALLCGCHFTDLISFVVAVSPSAVVTQGFQMTNWTHLLPKLLPCSPWTLGGEDIPYVHAPGANWRVVGQSLKSRTVAVWPTYEGVLERSQEENRIPVEKIQGPILLLASDRDDIWQSRQFSEAILQRLKEKNFSYPVQYHHYAYGSHMLVPEYKRYRGCFYMERKHRKENHQASRDAFDRIYDFLEII